ncbi:helix-turn-helix domain-containing protein [Acidisphaera sp. L21]|uniref:helix-turn-helix domain-containing protein n=1 Tax=Acidisphaera sp. L21 TaxID=1641851 RepID=UPI00131DD70F|nr:helix-turn-helix domain-containing protein [Acidisphaera sp. L21]
MTSDQSWIDRYEAAWRPIKGPYDPGDLTAGQRGVLVAMQTYRQRPGDPDVPTAETVAEIVGRPVATIYRAFKKLDELGYLPGAWP